MPHKFSMAGATVSIFKAKLMPPANPNNVPNKPIKAPCTMKIPITVRGVAPKVRNIAISA